VANWASTRGGLSVVLHCWSNCSKDGCIMCRGIIGSCQSAATSEIVKHCWCESTHVSSAITSTRTFTFTFISARQHAERAICYRKSACVSVRLSVTRVDQSKTGSCNFHYTVAPPLSCLQYKFNPEIPTGSPRAGPSNNGGLDRRENELILLLF